MIARRTALGLLGGLAGALVTPAQLAAAPPRKPPRLRQGDTVGLVAPASAVTLPDELDRAIHWIRGMGLVPKLGAHVTDQEGYLAGNDADRAADLVAMFAAPDVSAVFAVRLAGDVLDTGCNDGVVRMFTVSNGKKTRDLRGHDSGVFSVALCGGVLLSGSSDKTVRVWSVAEGEEGKCVAMLEGHTGAVKGVALVPSGGGRIVSLGATELIVWEPAGKM